mgnify:CR=1 FL=1
MDFYLDQHIHWIDLLIITLVLLFLRILLQWIYRLITHSPYLSKVGWLDGHLFRQLQVIYEPVAILILLGFFILINPLLHGILVAASLLIGYHHGQHYLSGRLIQLDNALRPGQRRQAHHGAQVFGAHFKHLLEGLCCRLGFALSQFETRQVHLRHHELGIFFEGQLEALGGRRELALGKQGANELNYSSDIDPILLFDPDRLPRRAKDEPGEAAQRYRAGAERSQEDRP